MSCAFLWNGTTTHPKGGLSGHISLLRTTVALSDGFPAPVILLLIFILNEKRGLFGGPIQRSLCIGVGGKTATIRADGDGRENFRIGERGPDGIEESGELF